MLQNTVHQERMPHHFQYQETGEITWEATISYDFPSFQVFPPTSLKPGSSVSYKAGETGKTAKQLGLKAGEAGK